MDALTHAKSPTEQAETAALIGALGLLFGESLPRARVALYELALEDVPVSALKAGFARAIKTRTWFPKPAELRADVDTMLEAAREAEQRRAQDATKRQAREPIAVFGRMPKARVLHHFRGFVAEEPCPCVACWEAKPAGPPRFVPDGVHPEPVCARCQDCGWAPMSSGGVERCLCVGSNPQLVESTRAHTIEMGRWLHGAELVEHEQAERAFQDALRGTIARRTMAGAR